MTTNRESHLKVYSHYFKPHQSYSISFNLANLGKVFFGAVPMNRYLSLEKKGTIFVLCSLTPTKRAREIRKFRVVVVQRRQRNAQNSVCTFKVVVC